MQQQSLIYYKKINKMLNIKQCPLCANTQFIEKTVCEDFYVTHEKFLLCQCNQCGFVFTQNTPEGEECEKYYNTENYISHSDTHKGFFNKAYHIVRIITLRQKIKIATAGKKTGSLLDVGCGTGYFAGKLSQKGWNVTGIEPSSIAAEIAREKFGIKVLSSESIHKLENRQFDVITLWHVLEHIDSLEDMMISFQCLLKEQGKLIVALPNINSYDASKYKNHWAAYDVPRHRWHFSPETFANLALKYGFSIKKIISMPFDVFYISILSEKYQKHRFAFLRGVCFGLRSFSACIFHKRKSSSLIYILNRI
jgi:2-polyprenyl-3-methyl-5-hydroxy-6-metoxy-1,4-benzoquinol methylase